MNFLGKTYKVKASEGNEKVLSVLEDSGTNFLVHLTSKTIFGAQESEELISKDLFQSCLRTGYLAEIDRSALTFAS